MRTIFSSSAAAVWLALTLCRPLLAADQGIGERDWLFGKQIEQYGYLFRGAQISDPVRDKLQEGFHRFAFEYWLLCRTRAGAASPWWRYQIRQMLHREAKSHHYFDDPAVLLPFFKNGKLVESVDVPPVVGLKLPGLADSDYRSLVSGFQATFFDATNVFPVNPIPPASAIAGGQTGEHLQLAELMSRKTWLLMPRDKLPVRYQEDPFAAFQLLSVTGRAYYLPAFLFMCERDSDRVGDLPGKLLSELVADAPQSVELRSRLGSAQKKSIATFFEDWFGSPGAAPLETLRKQLGVQPNK
jgi:hypothetical protein